MTKPHLDSEYRDRFIEFHMKDGSVLSSREINWRQVDWRQVVGLIAKLRGISHKVNNTNPGFKFFMNFRWGGKEPKIVNGKKIGMKDIHLWTIGWTDGIMCYLKDIDFKTGEVVKNYEASLKYFKSHIHPTFVGIVS